MKFGISCNPAIEERLQLCIKIAKILEPENEVLFEKSVAEKLGREGVSLKDMNVDVLIALGGDGTILDALQKMNQPVLGINAGVLGFLTEVGLDDMERDIKRILSGDYIIENRLKLKTMVDGERVQDSMNEAVLNTAYIAKMRHFEIFIDNHSVQKIRADAIIVATPTGSTCYAMSAGGPIIDPRVEALVVVPIAPFKLSIRPTVVPATSLISVRLVDPKPCKLVLDGRTEVNLSGQEELTFSISESKARFVRFGENFYERLREKLLY